MGHKILKMDMKQTFLNGNMVDNMVYIRPRDGWQALILEGHVLLLRNAIYGTWHAARTWHVHNPRADDQQQIETWGPPGDLLINRLFMTEVHSHT
jgi:hypothetical protein